MKADNKLYKDKCFWLLCVSMATVSIGLYYNFIIGERLYIYNDTGRDTITAYWPFYKYLLEAIRTGNLQGWSFSLGLGNNIFSIMWWLLDPFNIILLPLPIESIPYGFVFGMIAKIFISGIFFYLYLGQIKVKGIPAVIAALAWAFNGYMILWGQHYLFATTIALFAVIMYGIEKMISENKRSAFLIGLFLLIANSCYMAFFVSLFIAIYIAIRYFIVYKYNFVNFIKFIWEFIKVYILACGLGAFSLFPSAYLILNSARLDTIGKTTPNIFWDLKNYIGGITRLFSNNLLGINSTILSRNYYSFTMLGSTVLVVILLPQVITIVKTKKDKVIAVCIGSMLLLAWGTTWPAYVMNALNNIEMRWSFIIIFVLITILAIVLKNITITKTVNMVLVKAQIILSVLVLGATLILSIEIGINAVDTSYILNLMARLIVIGCLISAFTLILRAYNDSKQKMYMYMLLGVVIIELIITNYSTINKREYIVPEYIENMKGYYDGTSEVVSEIQNIDEGKFYRIEKMYNSQDANDSLMQNYFGTKFYTSLNIKNYYYLMQDMDKISDINKNRVWAINDSSQFESYLGIKYMLSSQELNKPNYKLFKTINNMFVYENQQVFPLGFTYDKYILKDQYKALDVYAKQDTMLDVLILEETNDKLIKANPYQYKEISIIYRETFNIELSEDITENRFIYTALSEDPQVRIILSEEVDNGIILEMDVHVQKNGQGKIYYSNSNEFTGDKSIDFKVNSNQNRYVIPLDSKNISHIRIDIGEKGEQIGITDIKVKERPGVEKILLQKDIFIIEDFKDNHISGHIETDKETVLIWTIPYDLGWQVKVDGEKVDKFISNVGFLGINLKEGYHKIELKYTPPGVILGISISMLSIGILLAICLNKKMIKCKH